MERSSESPPQPASTRSQLKHAREPVEAWQPAIGMTQPVSLPNLLGIREPGSIDDAHGDFLFQNIPAMIWIKDTENTVIKVNRWAAKAMGVEPEELEGRSEWEIHPDRAEEYYADDQKAFQTKEPIYGIVEHFQTESGESLWVVTDKIPILDTKGEVVGILDITRDISRQKEAENKVAKSQERIDLALWGAELGMWDLSLTSEIFDFDVRASRIVGLPNEQQQILFDDLVKMANPEDLPILVHRLKSHLEDEASVFEAEWRITDGRGGWRWILQKGKVVDRTSYGEPLRLSGTFLDVTSRKEIESEHDTLERKMQHTQKLESLGVLAGGIAHDFNNILTGILSQTGLARMEVQKGDADVDDHLRKIESAAQRMAQLTRQMLAYSGRAKFEIRRFDLNEVIEEIVFLLKASIGKKARYEMDLSEEPPYVEGDATQIHQVILNLVTNASDALGGKQGRISLRTGFADLPENDLKIVPWGSDLSPGKFVYVDVEDDGCGMDEETRTKLFEPFFTTKFTGRGLGMSAVLGIVRSHGGLIKVKSAPGVGSVFRVYLPASDPPEEVKLSLIKQTRRAPVEGGRFLIIDDELVVRSVFSQALRTLGFEYEDAEDGLLGIELFKRRKEAAEAAGGNRPYTGVFLDMTMPEMNGYEVYKELRSIDPGLPVCIMSGFTEEEIATQFENDPVAAFLPKPFQIDHIEEAIVKLQEAG